MGLDPIGYRSWKGQRSEHARRFLVIADQVTRQKLASLWLIAVLALGIVLNHVFSIIIMSKIKEVTGDLFALAPENAVLVRKHFQNPSNDYLNTDILSYRRL